MAKKAVNTAVALTLTLPGVAAKRGRPVSGKALSNSERQERFRKRHAIVETGDQISATIKRFAVEFQLPESHITRELLRFALCNRNWSRTGFPAQVTRKESA